MIGHGNGGFPRQETEQSRRASVKETDALSDVYFMLRVTVMVFTVLLAESVTTQ